MANLLDYNVLDVALDTLGALLEEMIEAPINIVVCGGSSLIATNMVSRTTKDVDIVAMLDSMNKIIEAQPLPEQLLEAAGKVAGSMNLPANWLNNGPRSIVNSHLPNHGLPNGFQERLIKRTYGVKLGVYFLGRVDQIYFKLFAAVDLGGPSRHLDDLNSLSPTDDELFAAAQWVKIQDPSDEFEEIMKKMLRMTGYDHVAERL